MKKLHLRHWMQTIGESIIHNQYSEPAYIFIHRAFKYITAFLWEKKKIFGWKEIKKKELQVLSTQRNDATSSSVFIGAVSYFGLCFQYTSLSYVWSMKNEIWL